jgi:glycosyltransferase involved in cell wall biosynthesis
MHVMIGGIRGVPAQHGGFETFAEDLSLFLVSRNHQVTVYCQTDRCSVITEDVWQGVHRVLIPAGNKPMDTIFYDWATTRHASRSKGVVLTLGYNTGAFSLIYKLRHMPSVMNMDGIEWKRRKWSLPQRAWLWCNEWAGARSANHLIADHPQIAAHLQRHTAPEKISIIPYGADEVKSAKDGVFASYSLRPKGYYLLVARPEPENSILEIVRAFSSPRVCVPLVVLGGYGPQMNHYQRQVLDAAGTNVRFAGAIYDHEIVRSLRYYAKAYIHGHRVGGTNPSLVEALAAGNAVIAHDNRFTRWVAGSGARYFTGTQDLEDIVCSLEENPRQLSQMEEAGRLRHDEEFVKRDVLLAYEELLARVACVYD